MNYKLNMAHIIFPIHVALVFMKTAKISCTLESKHFSKQSLSMLILYFFSRLSAICFPQRSFKC